MPRFVVRESLDVYEPRRLIRKFALELGFSKNCGVELAIVVSELVSNVLKYGIAGSIEFERCSNDLHGLGMRIAATDIGPPFRNIELAMKDGYDDSGPIDPGTMLRRGGLGTGLGAILRLTDSFALQYGEGSKTIVVERYVMRPRARPNAALEPLFEARRPHKRT